MEQIDALRERYSELSTDALREMWSDESRVDWAEAELRRELLERGVSLAELDEIAGRRVEIALAQPPKVRDTVVAYGILGRAGALFISAGVGGVTSALLGHRAAMLAVLGVIGAYVGILYRRVFWQFRGPVGGWGGTLMVWQCVEAGIIFVVALMVVVTSFARGD